MTIPAEKPAAPDDVAAAKHAARKRARETRACLDVAVCREHAVSIAQHLLALPELGGVTTMLTYAALPAELDPALAIDALRARGVRIAYPRIEAPGLLGLHLVDDEGALVLGPLSIRQPAQDMPRVGHDEIDAVIIPGVAFDARGARLGYGGGYYDRLLPVVRPECTRIGVAFDEQILPIIPAEEHDEHVDIVVTPTQVIRTGRPRC